MVKMLFHFYKKYYTKGTICNFSKESYGVWLHFQSGHAYLIEAEAQLLTLMLQDKIKNPGKMLLVSTLSFVRGKKHFKENAQRCLHSVSAQLI